MRLNWSLYDKKSLKYEFSPLGSHFCHSKLSAFSFPTAR